MRKLKLQMQMTINGYVGGINGENDWMTWNPDDEFITFLSSLIDSSNTLLLGRKTAEGIIPFWEKTAKENPSHPFAKKIARLKKEKGKDILVFGGAGFVSSLIKEQLIDEYHLIINPTAMSKGMTIFNSLDRIQKFTPTQSKLYPGGKTVLSFTPKNE